MSPPRQTAPILLFALGLIAAALTLSGCLWVGPGPRPYRGGPVIITPWRGHDFHRGGRPYRKPYDRRWHDDGRRYSHPRG